jgi:hypothetical protein
MSARDLPPEHPPGHLGVPAADLQALLLLVVRARREADLQRRPGSTPDRVVSARWGLLDALINYTEALKQRGLPVPRVMGGEITLLRGLCGIGTRRPYERP